MSVTTTANPITSTSMSVLADYEIHQSGRPYPASPSWHPAPESASQPNNWPVDHQRVPAYLPVNRNLDRSERPAGSNRFKGMFITVMLHGVWLNSVVSRVWRNTGGLLSDRAFRYDVGGEW
ncbi:uncharacterized protein ASPGLDRAFT_124290 [Aspergillus glaucus CBS 516.65]|uniref:Uncharacterized protein n=1 Tax=Aspergillus glaucus CBS 516.65 TaxID=1160497 RepID=A0A1L9VM63_ASPGL|nr:hypothetical protein ASPGLDRAFT_124290 [Aspergillus glaucus CBS 516.65]OJJ85013.1 hypothetical protein ASPGLDRAFT_124290 [Aspergillus glaucus CBS 516.65]